MRSAALNIAVMVTAGAMAFGQATAPAAPTPPAQAAPAVPATPATPAAPAAPAKPRTRVRTYRVIESGSYLGVDTRNVTAERAGALKLQEPSGVEITMVDQDGPAGKAGLKEHDVIVGFNGSKVTNADELRTLIRNTPAGKDVTLAVVRDGHAMNITAQVASRQRMLARNAPRGSYRIVVPEVGVPAMAWDIDVPQFSVLQFWSRNGLMVEDLTPQLGEYFGVRNGEGVLVRTVEKGSPAEAAGIHAGDVITRVNNERIGCTSDWRNTMRQQSGNNVSLGIVRDKREQTLSMKVPERAMGANTYHIDMPNLDPALEQMRNQLQRMGPQIQRSIDSAQSEAMRELERSMAKMEREMERANREMDRSLRERERAERDRERAQEKAEQERERAQEKAEQERERAQEQAQRDRERAEQERERAQQQAERARERARQQQTPPPATPPAQVPPPAPPPQ